MASTATSGERDERARRVAPIFAPRCTTSPPTVIHATAWCTGGNEKPQGNHREIEATPLNRRKSEPPTSGNSEIRSIACAALRMGGHVHKLGYTVQSFARSNGIDAIPVVTWMPCESR